MSVEAISWALNLAPVPVDRSGQPSSPCKFVLVGLANHAGPDGAGAFPSVRTLMRYTGLAERTVRGCLARLEAEGVISPCDPAVVAARIRRADRRPKGWDLSLARIRGDLDQGDAEMLERQFPGLAARLAASQTDAGNGKPDDGVLAPHAAGAVDNPVDGVHTVHPVPRTGCSGRPDGVHQVPERGARGAPEPSIEPTPEPPAARPRETPTGPASPCGPADGGGPAGEFFATLGPVWRLTASQRARLTPAVAAALSAGWTPAALAAFIGASTTGIRNPYAVLAARISSAELPLPSGHGVPRRPWCGQCDERTRLLGFDGDAPRRCPRCRPVSAASTPPRPAYGDQPRWISASHGSDAGAADM